jgi:hypothetical protein
MTTAGAANPTLTIVALALRQAETRIDRQTMRITFGVGRS